MTIQQTIEIPAGRKVRFDVAVPDYVAKAAPRKSPLAKPSEKRLLTRAEFEAGVECPMDHTPNAVTIAAIQEVQDMIDGKIPRTVYHSLDEMIEALHS